MLDIAREVEVRVADRLQLAHDTQHLMYLVLGLIGQTSVSYLVQVLRNLVLHSVAYTFVFLDTRVDLRELSVIVLVEQVMYHTDHTLCAQRKDMYFLPSLKDRQLGSRHKATGDKLELTVRIFLFGFGRDDEHHQFLQPRDESDKDTGVEDVKRGVEGSEYRVQLIRRDVRRHTRGEVYAPYPTYAAYKPTEHAEHPYHAEEVEYQVGHSRTACLYRSREGHDIRGDGCTDVLAEDERDTHVYRQHVRRAECHGDGHNRRRGLYGKGQNTADEQVQEITAVAPTGGSQEEIPNGLHLVEMHLRRVDLQGREA